MRILHVASGIDVAVGGPVAALRGLVAAQQAQGEQVTIVSTFRSPSGSASPLEDLKNQGIRLELIGPAPGGLSRHPDIQSVLSRLIGEADIVHIHALWEEIQHQAARLARRRGISYIFRPCGMLDPWSLAQGKWKKRLYLAWRLRRDLNHAAAIHFTAEAERDLTAALHLVPPSIIEPNGVDLSEFADLPPRGLFRSKHPALSDRPIVLFLSRLHPKKGLDLLIPAFAAGAPQAAMLVLAGPGENDYQDEVRRLVQKYGLNERVVMPGLLRGRERIEAYADADLFCLPSYQENFGIVVVEAMATGVPVLISDHVNIWPDIVKCGAGGVTSMAIEPLANAISGWMNDAPRRATAGAAGRSFAFECYGWQSIAARWKQHYIQLCRR